MTTDRHITRTCTTRSTVNLQRLLGSVLVGSMSAQVEEMVDALHEVNPAESVYDLTAMFYRNLEANCKAKAEMADTAAELDRQRRTQAA